MADNDDFAARTGEGVFGAGMSRRQVLKALASGGAGLAASPLLSRLAWGSEPAGPGGLPLARPNRPVKLPLYEDPIKSGLKPETGGTFTVFNYADYLDKKLLDEFGKKYKVKTLLTTFSDMDQAITRLATHAVDVDVTEITPDRLDQAVAGKLLKPINHSYIPNLKDNVWPQLHSPFYDVDSHYTVPYTVYTTGIGWRSDKVSEDIAKLDNPWSIFWKAQQYKGMVGLINSPREALGLAMLYRHFYELNTEDPKRLDQALADLKALMPICSPKVNNTEYQTLAQGSSWLHQAWSGDLLTGAMYYLPKGTSPKVLRYWTAPKGKGPIQNDCWAISSTTKKPVLAHLWLNFLLEEKVAYSNFVNFTGYQPPINSIDTEALVNKGLIPEQLHTAVIKPDQIGPSSLQYMTLTSKGQALWQNAYSRFISGT